MNIAAGPSRLPRKAYTKPCLRIHGTIEEITQANATVTADGDNSNKMNHKTGG